MSEPRAFTADELRDKILNHMRALRDYWAKHPSPKTIEDRIDGAMFSVLSMLDGSTMALPAFDLVARPHEDDKAYCIDQGENWIEPGTTISDMLHEHWHQKERT